MRSLKNRTTFRRLSTTLLGVGALLNSAVVLAAELPLTITYQGRLYDSSSQPIETTVDLQLDVFSQDGSCLLYSETKQLDLSASDGFFSTQIGSVLGATSRTSGVDPGLSMQAVFDNSSAKTGASSCSYTPSARDGRKIQVTILKIGATTVNTVLSPKQNITSVPYATVAQTLQGKSADKFVQLTGSITQSDFEGLMAKKSELLNLAAQESTLLALAAGTSTTYLKSSMSGTNLSGVGDIAMSAGKSLQLGTFTTSQQSTLTGSLSSSDAGKTWYNSETKKLMYWDGSAAQTVGDGDSNLQASTLSVSGASTFAGNVNVNSGKFFVDATNAKVGIGTAAPTNDLSLSGQAAKTVGMERHSTADTAGNNLTVSSGGATSGATDKNGGKLVLSSGISTGAGASSIEFQTATAGSTGTSDNAPSTKMVITGDGKVGIGTTSPTAPLSVNDSVQSTSNFSTYNVPNKVIINDLYTNTASGQFSTMSLFSQSGVSANSSSIDTALQIDQFVPATQSFNASNKIALRSYATNKGTGTVAGLYGAQLQASHGGSSTAGIVYGSTLNSNNDSTGTVTYGYGLYARSRNNSTGTIEYGSSIRADVYNATGGTITSAKGLDITVSNSGTITNAYGLYIYGVGSGGTWTNTPYDIYAADTGASNYFAGNTGIGTIDPSVSLDISGKTDAIRLPAGTTAQRPTAAAGLLRYNSDDNVMEAYVNGAWRAVATAATAVDLSSSQTIAGTKTYSDTATFSATGPSVALDVTGSGGLQTTLLNVTGATTMAGNLNVNSGKFFVNASTAKVGIGTASPSYDLSFLGTAAKTLGMERHSTADTAGSNMTLVAGGAASGATDKNGGTLLLSGGTSTGTGTSSIEFQTATAGSTGTADNAPSTKMTILGSGNVGIGTTSPVSKLTVSGNTAAAPGTAPAGTSMVVHSADSASASVQAISIAGSPSFVLKRALGTTSAPTYLTDGNVIGSMSFSGWNEATSDWAAQAVVQAFADGTWDASNRGTQLRFRTTSGTSLNYAMTIRATGDVGIGTTTPRAKLDVNGAIVSAAPSSVTYAAGSTNYIDWSLGNTQEVTSFTCDGSTTLNFRNLKAGGAYTLIIAAASHTGTCKFASDSSNGSITVAANNWFVSGGTLAPTASKQAVITLLVSNSSVYMSMVDDMTAVY